MDGYEWVTGNDGVDRQYDVTLAAIPVVFVLSYLMALAHLSGSTPALLVAAMTSGLLILAALFFDPPRDASS